MAKCSKCGRGGLFRKVNASGLCHDCEILVQIETKCAKRSKELSELEATLNDYQSEYERLKEKAFADAMADAENKKQQMETRLQQAETTALQMEERARNANEEAEKREKAAQAAIRKVQRSKELIKAIQHAGDTFDRPDTTAADADITALLADINDFLQPTVEIDLQCLNMRDLRKKFKENEKRIEETLQKYQGRYTTKANATIYKLMVIALRAELLNILYSIKFGKLEDAIKNVKTVTAKYYAIAVDGNQNIAPTMRKFIGEIEFLFLEAVQIEYEYYVQKERAKEEQRAIREQMRQEAEERRELERQQKQVEKEEKKFHDQISQLTMQMENSDDEAKSQQLLQRIEELQNQLSMVAEKKDKIVNLQNGKAGNVYVISNIGSFGEEVFKIGMTRRLDPQERVDELGSASVPFPFDIHSMIFSEDAVSLESELHHILNDQRVNKVNLRKEFFRVPLDEIEALVAKIAPTAEFRRTVLAEQYRQSLSIDKVVLSSEEEVITDEDEG